MVQSNWKKTALIFSRQMSFLHSSPEIIYTRTFFCLAVRPSLPPSGARCPRANVLITRYLGTTTVLVKPTNNQQPPTANDWSGSSAKPEACDENDNDDSSEGEEEEKSSDVPQGRGMSRSSRRRVGAAGSTSSRRRPSARARGAASVGETCGADSVRPVAWYIQRFSRHV